MKEKWVVQRIRNRDVIGVREDGATFCYTEEEITVGHGSDLTNAISDFNFNNRRKYEKPNRQPVSYRNNNSWGR